MIKKDQVDVLLLQNSHLSNAGHPKLNRQVFNQVYSSSYETGHRRAVAYIEKGNF